ncbi:LysM peptidoglycan-binding domain-containing protein [Alkaliphilus sp. MSJ-5]|uniref:LysM peptidoglycan-binding domain-containing protein n=1 Tax=Alkaliphilus flagellatus TaxID=2841507 RepID=A0ABS6G3M8_9FIRM|nr:LysM peptidoglycan-binding domain-containing protein [Alkaliphilus flagellatus]MBU5676751.1 LysM peptidoglycan-binding domain-containing protein [Alkaliphilus flagellatus]
MYSCSIDNVKLPVAPSKIARKINTKSKTVDLMNLGEVNILKEPGLTEISFEVLLPSVEYPFAVYENGFKEPLYYLDLFKKLITGKKPFIFELNSLTPAGYSLFMTRMEVTLESYSIIEDSSNGMDIVVSLELKEYKRYTTQTLKMLESSSDSETPKFVIVEERPAKEPVKSYTVISGDTLWTICKKQLGDGSKYKEIATLNNIKNPDLIFPGQVLRLR